MESKKGEKKIPLLITTSQRSKKKVDARGEEAINEIRLPRRVTQEKNESY